MIASLLEHLRHHARFYGSGLLGVLVFPFAGVSSWLRLVVAGDVFFFCYLASTAVHGLGSTPERLRRRASYEDEGVIVIFLLTLSAVSLCLIALFALLNPPGNAPGPPPTSSLVLAILSVPLGWFTLHTVTALRYAHLYYAPAPVTQGEPRDAGGLEFPGNREPDAWDFFYYSFVVGMTAQVSDVQTSSAAIRRTTLAPGVISFFFNTVILALA